MAYRLRVLAALPENLSLSLSIHFEQLTITHNSSTRGPDTFLWSLWKLALIFTPTHTIKNKFLKMKS